MGGDSPDFQVLRETKRLATFVRWVAQQQPDQSVALVLNGDVVDTLAENAGDYVAVNNALPVIERIMGDLSFSPIWDALAHFVRTPNRTLAVVIGNHDVELSFPSVQHLILSRLAGESLEARARIEFATVGAGYTCNVGTARVFCTHGNEVDPWNYVRYEDVSRAARRLNCGRLLEPSEWEPNAGTKMVKDVMNDIKRTYAWIDLLKPETQAAIGVLLVLDPSQAAKITDLPPIVGKLIRGTREFGGRLGAEGLIAQDPSDRLASLEQLLGPNVAQSLKTAGAGAQHSADDMLLTAETNFQTPRHGSLPEDQTLGAPRLIWDRLTGWVRGVGSDEALRQALRDWLADDKTFDFDTRDYTFEHVTQSIGDSIDFVITGHSHLERAIDMGNNRYYFNCGTWIRLLCLTDAMLKDTESFKPVYDVLKAGTMASIDAASFDGRPFVLDRTSAVCIKTDARGVVATLGHVDGSDRMVKVVRELVRH